MLLLLACHKDLGGDTAAVELVAAVVDPSRAGHFFDAPFPDDALRTDDGGVDLSGYPTSEGVLAGIVQGWAGMASEATRGFSPNMPAYFRFEGPLSLPESTEGTPDDPVLWVDLDSGALHPLTLRFVEDPLDDPYWGANTLAAVPCIGHTPRSGARLAAVVMQSAGATSPEGYAVPDEVVSALELAGVTGVPAVATVFTVHDSLAQLEVLAAAAHDWWEASDRAAPTWKRVVGLSYAPGETEGGEEATIQTVTFEDGTTEQAFLAAQETAWDIDLVDDWPMAVYQAELAVPYFQGLEGRPWMTPGVGMLLDTDRRDGWIHFAADGLTLESTPDTDVARLVLSIPLQGGAPIDDAPLVIWDHGTGGTAYNHVYRKNGTDEQRDLTALFAERGVAILSKDQPLYGTRFPLVDSGFTDGSLGFYNIANLPVFRDNQRQGGLEGEVVKLFAEEGLNASLPAGSIDTDRIARFGHSLGSVTANNGLAANPDWGPTLLSGAGSILTLNFLESGLAGTGHGLFDTLSSLFGIDPSESDDLGYLLAAALGLEDEEARLRVDRLHPAIGLFQWLIDPSDPSTFGHGETLPITVLMGIGDWQVPNAGTEALVEVLPEAALAPCEPLSDYDPHHCAFREPQALEIVGAWLDSF